MRSRTSIALLAVGHACVDIYQGAVAALVPFFVAERAYTYAAVAGIVLAASLLSSVAQPLFGALTDRWAMPWLLPVSTLLGGVGIAGEEAECVHLRARSVVAWRRRSVQVCGIVLPSRSVTSACCGMRREGA